MKPPLGWRFWRGDFTPIGPTLTGPIFRFQILLAVATFKIVVHVWGALLRIHPASETLEIGMCSGQAVLKNPFDPSQCQAEGIAGAEKQNGPRGAVRFDSTAAGACYRSKQFR